LREPSLFLAAAPTIFPVGGATGEHLTALLTDEHVPVDTVETHDWTRQNLHVHVNASGEQYRFVMPGAHWLRGAGSS
jgi:6-phosphofructokinase 2